MATDWLSTTETRPVFKSPEKLGLQGLSQNSPRQPSMPSSSLAPARPRAGHLADVASLDLTSGADNLLLGCMQVRPGERLLLVREDSRHGFYDCIAPAFTGDRARVLGLDVVEIEAGPPGDGRDLPDDVERQLGEADHALFFARIGDQLRFEEITGHCAKTISYAFDAACLGSGYGTTPHALMSALKAHIDTRLATADNIRITCPLGTELIGSPLGMSPDPSEGDVTIKRFPLNVFKPVPASGFSGRVALARWLVGTGSRYYEPYELMFDDVAFALLEYGRIVGFEGPKDVVEKVRRHHQAIGDLFSIDPTSVHSWHAGIHPHTFYPLPATHNLTRWSALAFGSPRYLHFHVCGDRQPGEISWTVIDPSISINGHLAWDQGQLVLLETMTARSIIARYTAGTMTFGQPRAEIGV